jgi:hypothetical protein
MMGLWPCVAAVAGGRGCARVCVEEEWRRPVAARARRIRNFPGSREGKPRIQALLLPPAQIQGPHEKRADLPCHDLSHVLAL